jgi:hypothetical protein
MVRSGAVDGALKQIELCARADAKSSPKLNVIPRHKCDSSAKGTRVRLSNMNSRLIWNARMLPSIAPIGLDNTTTRLCESLSQHLLIDLG